MADVSELSFDRESSERTDPVLTSAYLLQFGREQLPPRSPASGVHGTHPIQFI